MIKSYLPLVAREAVIREADVPHRPRTVYVGGGTPSLLGTEGFEALVYELHNNAGIFFDDVEEWTVELNPASATPELLKAMRKAGVTRVSIGVQSFCDATLSRIGRIHNAEMARAAIRTAQSIGFADTGFDLIANLPDVSQAEWQSTVDEAITFAPKHISVYSLIIEPGTPLHIDNANGKLGKRLDDEEEMDLLRWTEGRLREVGLERYEISNYGQPGFFCKHNLAVWRGEDYVGLGPAASSRIGCRRRTNALDLYGYSAAIQNGCLPPASEDEILTSDDDVIERFVYGLRLKEGVSPKEFASVYPAAVKYVTCWEKKLNTLMSLSVMENLSPHRWRLSPRGFEVCDAVIEEFL